MKQPPRVGPQGEERLDLSTLSSAHRNQREEEEGGGDRRGGATDGG